MQLLQGQQTGKLRWNPPVLQAPTCLFPVFLLIIWSLGLRQKPRWNFNVMQFPCFQEGTCESRATTQPHSTFPLCSLWLLNSTSNLAGKEIPWSCQPLLKWDAKVARAHCSIAKLLSIEYIFFKNMKYKTSVLQQYFKIEYRTLLPPHLCFSYIELLHASLGDEVFSKQGVEINKK